MGCLVSFVPYSIHAADKGSVLSRRLYDCPAYLPERFRRSILVQPILKGRSRQRAGLLIIQAHLLNVANKILLAIVVQDGGD